jgi:predicted RNA-binding Zn ribbon-like protein
VGGNVVFDLLNTQNGAAGEAPEDDVLTDYRDLLAWASHVGLLTAAEERSLRRRARERPADADAAFARVRETRAYLHGLFEAVAQGTRPAPADLLRLQRDAAEAFAHGRLVSVDGQYGWSWADDKDLRRPLWPIIDAALTLVTDGPLDRVKGCASCRFLFVDESKNRSRRWCSMEDCGAEDKMRKYVARRASARARKASQ